MTRPHTSQRLQSMSRSLTGTSESAHREDRRRQTESEQKQQIPSGSIIKKTLLEQLSDTGPPLVSRMMMIRPDTRSASGTSHGSHVMRPVRHTSHCHLPRRSLYSRIYPETSRRRKHRSSTPRLSLSSLSRSGSVSCLDAPSTLTTSLPAIIPLRMKRNALSISATSSSSSAGTRNPPRPSKHMVTGFLRGIKQLKRRSSSLSTEVRSSESTDATSHSSSRLSTHHFTAGSSSTTVPCATVLHNDETSCSPISPSSQIYTSSTSKNLASLAVTQKGVPVQSDQVRDARMLADVSTRADAPTRKLLAPMPTCAQNVATICTLPTNARQRLEERRWENRPRYTRGLIWTNNDPTHTTLAAYTETMPALPSAPTNELNNPAAHATIHLHPHLFQLITPINIDCLESLLTTLICQGRD